MRDLKGSTSIKNGVHFPAFWKPAQSTNREISHTLPYTLLLINLFLGNHSASVKRSFHKRVVDIFKWMRVPQRFLPPKRALKLMPARFGIICQDRNSDTETSINRLSFNRLFLLTVSPWKITFALLEWKNYFNPYRCRNNVIQI